jgi:hypothetical protein
MTFLRRPVTYNNDLFDDTLDELKSEIAMYECGDSKRGELMKSLRRLIRELNSNAGEQP